MNGTSVLADFLPLFFFCPVSVFIRLSLASSLLFLPILPLIFDTVTLTWDSHIISLIDSRYYVS